MIEVNNTTRSAIDESFLKKVAERVLKGEKRTDAGLSVAIVGQKKMQELNKKYRKRDKTANVLSFPMGNERIPSSTLRDEPSGSDSNESEVKGYLGEIVLCPQEVRKDAKKYGILFKEALAWMLIHGILHLLGYNHEEGGEEAQTMEKKEASYLKMVSEGV